MLTGTNKSCQMGPSACLCVALSITPYTRLPSPNEEFTVRSVCSRIGLPNGTWRLHVLFLTSTPKTCHLCLQENWITRSALNSCLWWLSTVDSVGSIPSIDIFSASRPLMHQDWQEQQILPAGPWARHEPLFVSRMPHISHPIQHNGGSLSEGAVRVWWCQTGLFTLPWSSRTKLSLKSFIDYLLTITKVSCIILSLSSRIADQK